MKRFALFIPSALLVTAIGFGVVSGDTPKPGAKADEKKATEKPKSSDKADSSATDRDEKKSASPEQAADEQAIRKSAETYLKAYHDGNAKDAAAHFTKDAEYVDEDGNVYQGRQAIEELLDACFKRNPGSEMDIDIQSIKFISPGVALEDGTAVVARSADSEPAISHYSAVHVKTDGKWQIASVRERFPKDRRQHRSQLAQLNWLQGEWVDEDRDTSVYFICAPIDNGNFLMRAFAMHVNGEQVISGSQRIGWDPLSGKLKTWIFDSEGGYGEGFWFRDDDRWVMKAIGVTASGEMASMTSIYKMLNDQTMTWQSVDHEVGGIRLPDSDVITIVRRAEAPQIQDETGLKGKVDDEIRLKPSLQEKTKPEDNSKAKPDQESRPKNGDQKPKSK